MAFDLNNFVIDRIVRGVATDMKSGDVLFSINQITNPSLSCTSESTDAVDALNVPIATFYRAKTAEFSAENALFDMNLLATQTGTTKNVASDKNKIAVPCFETIEIKAPADGDTVALKLSHTPLETAGHYVKVYVLKGDGTLGDKVDTTKDAKAPNGRSVYVRDGRTLTVAYTKTDADNNGIGDSGFMAGEQLFVMYDYEADGASETKEKDGTVTEKARGAVEVVNSATKFPVGCKFIMEILGADVCNQTDLIYAYLIFPNCKLSPDFDWSIATDSTHPFSMKAMQEYCDKQKRLFSIIIPE